MAEVKNLFRVGLGTLVDDRLTFLDPEGLALVGGTSEACLGRKLEDLLLPGFENGEFAQARQSGKRLLVRRETPHFGGPAQLALVFVDEYLSAAEARARVQLRDTIEAVIAGFAHEVRNPMASILMLTEEALAQDSSPDSPLVSIPSLVSRVERLIKQALTYSRPKAPHRALHRMSFLIEQSLGLLRPRERPVPISVAEFDDRLALLVDLEQAEQVLVNLLENAIDAARSIVYLRASATPGSTPSAVLEIEDDGDGVAPEVLARIFEPFLTTKAQGTGLGLAIARDLARLNGGNLIYERGARGALFRLTLPGLSP